MTVKLRWIGGLCAIALGTGSYVLAAHAAQSAYPSKPLRLLVPFTPGGSQDVAARLISAPAAQALGQNIVIDNRPGSGGLIAAQEAARATPDGYTLFMSSGAQMGISPALRPKIGYDPVKSFTHVIHLTDTPMVLIAYPSLSAANAKELIAYSHANRGKVNTASTGTGTYTHMTDEILRAGERAGWKDTEDALQVRVTGGVTPERQMQLATFLASDRSNHVSGKLIHVEDDWKRLEGAAVSPEMWTLRRVVKG